MDYIGSVVLVDTDEYEFAELFYYEEQFYIGVNEDGGMIEVKQENIVGEFDLLS